MEMNKQLKAIPYGIGNFNALRRNDYVYCDKTKFIELLEIDYIHFPFIVRPRRFGKTLFTNTLFDYYDSAKASTFDESFKGTYIYDHKTPKASSYCVLYCSFAGIAYGDVVSNFTHKLKSCCEEFLNRYPVIDKSFLDEDYLTSGELFRAFILEVTPLIPHRLYVIIDEYDYVATELFFGNEENANKNAKAGRFIQDFYTALKEACDSGAVARTFITGVTSVSYDPIITGFDIAEHISSDPRFASMFGFTEDELKKIIPQVVDLKRYGHSVDEVFARMKELYQGYRFSTYCEDIVFNPSMSLYYLDGLSVYNDEPYNLLDPAFAQNLSKIHGILSLGDVDYVKKLVTRALHFEKIPGNGLDYFINLSSRNFQYNRDLIAMMVYLGYLTYADDKCTFKVPNKIICTQFFGYYLEYLCGINVFYHDDADFGHAFVELAKGEPRLLFETVSAHFKKNRGTQESISLDESNLQTVLLAVLYFSDDYDVNLAVDNLEQGKTELIFQAKNATKPSYIFELKYLKKTACSEELVAKAKSEALSQLERYKTANNVADIPNLKQVVAVFGGFELKECVVF